MISGKIQVIYVLVKPACNDFSVYEEKEEEEEIVYWIFYTVRNLFSTWSALWNWNFDIQQQNKQTNKQITWGFIS